MRNKALHKLHIDLGHGSHEDMTKEFTRLKVMNRKTGVLAPQFRNATAVPTEATILRQESRKLRTTFSSIQTLL